MKNIVSLFLFTFMFTSCNKEKTCADSEQRIRGTVLRISGPDSLRHGETVPLLIEVEADKNLCIDRAEGLILDTVKNYVQIGADIIYTGNRGTNNCNCFAGEKIYTIIYFTPEIAGTYIFGIAPPSPLVSNGTYDSSDYRIKVK